jgi:hypothetical protein
VLDPDPEEWDPVAELYDDELLEQAATRSAAPSSAVAPFIR